jgi:hypothetical protein
MGFINWLGVAFEVVGLSISGIGLWATWHEFAPANEPFLRPLVDPTRAAFTALRVNLETLARRVLRLPPKATVIHAQTLQATASVAGRLSLRLGYGNLSDDVQAALAELHRRTQQLMDMHSRTDERLADERAAREQAIKVMSDELAASVGRLEGRGQRIAVGGIRMQTAGLFLVMFGLMLQVWRP